MGRCRRGGRCRGRSGRGRSCRWCGRSIRGRSIGCGSRCGGALATAVLEVGRIPARALELEAGSCQLLGEGLGPAGRTGRQRGIRDFPQHVLGMTAGATLVCINRHGANANTREDAKLSIIGIRPILRLSQAQWPRRGRPQGARTGPATGGLNEKCQSRRLAFHQARPPPLPGLAASVLSAVPGLAAFPGPPA